MKPSTPTGTLLLSVCSLFLATAAGAAEEPEIQVVPVADGIHMLVGPGGNVGVASGPDKVFLIDDKFEETSQAVLDAVGEIHGGILLCRRADRQHHVADPGVVGIAQLHRFQPLEVHAQHRQVRGRVRAYRHRVC